MATYCMSDIHGNYEGYQKLLEKIHFSDLDVLYVLGDVVDRGKASMKVLQDMMMRENVIPLIGNHEYMALQCLEFLMSEITVENIMKCNESLLEGLLEWLAVGGQSTIDEFQQLSYEERIDIIEYLKEFLLYEVVEVNSKDYILVHAGLSHFSISRDLSDYDLYEMIFEKPDYSKIYFEDRYLVTGHTPTRLIENHEAKDCVYMKNNHIAIDCGSGYGGRLGVICLDNHKVYYADE